MANFMLRKMLRKRNRLVILCVISAVVALPAVAQPKLLMADQYAWGIVVPSGETGIVPEVQTDIVLVNTGTETLEIHDVRPNCGCTTAPLDTKVLKPGDSTYMHILMKLPANNGLVTKFVTVVTNEPKDSVHALKLTAQVERPLQLSSAFLAFNTTDVGIPSTGKVSITSYNPSPVEVRFSTPTTGAKILSAPTVLLEQTQSVEVEVQYLPTNTGKFEVELVLQSKLPGYANVTISGYGMAMPAK